MSHFHFLSTAVIQWTSLTFNFGEKKKHKQQVLNVSVDCSIYDDGSLLAYFERLRWKCGIMDHANEHLIALPRVI